MCVCKDEEKEEEEEKEERRRILSGGHETPRHVIVRIFGFKP